MLDHLCFPALRARYYRSTQQVRRGARDGFRFVRSVVFGLLRPHDFQSPCRNREGRVELRKQQASACSERGERQRLPNLFFGSGSGLVG